MHLAAFILGRLRDVEGQREEETLVTFRRADMASGFMLFLQFLRSQLDKTGDKEQIAAYLF